MSDEDIEYIEEDLRLFCIQEIVVFRVFVEIVEKLENEIVVIDIVLIGYILLFLDLIESYNKEIFRLEGDILELVIKLLFRLRNEKEIEVVIVILVEIILVYEVMRF